MKKNLIIVDSLPNILIAVIIRKMFMDEHFDIIIPSKRSALEKIYNNDAFIKHFNKVYYADYDAINNFVKKALVILDAGSGISMYLSEKLDNDYTDLFFWNPSEFLYVLYAFLKCGNDFKTHIYADAFGGYTVDAPDKPCDIDGINEMSKGFVGSYPFFKFGIWDFLFKKKYKVPYVRDMDYDFYMFKPELSVIKRTHNVVELSCNEFQNNIELLNSVYGYNNDYHIKNRWVFLTGVMGEKREIKEDEKIIDIIARELEAEGLSIKPHPRQDASVFFKYSVDVIKTVFTMECYSMNNDLKDYIFISDESSSIFYTALVLEKKITVIWLRSLFNGSKVYHDKLWRFYVNKMIENGCRCFEPKSEEELKNTIRMLKNKKECSSEKME